MPHIFISYAKRDTRLLAESLFHALNALPDVTAWMDMSLEADDSWAHQIMVEIDRCDYVVVLVSPDVNRPVTKTQRRSFVLNEIDYALQDNKTILPVMVARIKLPVQIAGVQYIDLTDTPSDPAPIVKRVIQRFGVRLEQNNDSPGIAPRQVNNVDASPLTAQDTTKLSSERTDPQRAPFAQNVPVSLIALADRQETSTAQSANARTSTGRGIKLPFRLRRSFIVRALISVLIIVVLVFAIYFWIELYVVRGYFNAKPTLPDAPLGSEVFDGFEMVQVPEGCFMMGDDTDQRARPAHPQCIEKAFWIDRTPVTNEQFERLSGVTPSPVVDFGPYHPRKNISWEEAAEFCALRDARLPTEREWEYAARGPENLRYPWGNAWNPANVFLEDIFPQNNFETTNVGSVPGDMSWVGAMDMLGNGQEWVSTIFGISDDGNSDYTDEGDRLFPYPYTPSDGREAFDISQPSNTRRVTRGFDPLSFYTTQNPQGLTLTLRGWDVQTMPVGDTGFRCVRDL